VSRPRIVCLLLGREYKPGDPSPNGYTERIEWAKAQMAAGHNRIGRG
jgi:hypothetical protein